MLQGYTAPTLNVVTPPAVEPFLLAEAKIQLRVDSTFTADDALITSMIVAARQYCEMATRRAFITTTFDLFLDGFPYGGGYYNRAIRQSGNPYIYGLPTNAGVLELPRPPLQSVTSITYLDSTGNTQTLATSVYRIVKGSEGLGKVTTQPGQVFPVTLPQIGSATVRFVSGYGDAASSVPDGIKNAMKLCISHWYNHREAVSDGTFSQVPMAVDALLSPFQWGSYA